MNALQKRIRAAYAACYRLCEHNRDAEAWFRRSFEAAQRGEREHRAMGARFTRGAARYKLPVADAARYFAVKWFLNTERGGPGRGGQVTSFADACSMREDALYALGARDAIVCQPDKLAAWHKLREDHTDVVTLDYSDAFAGAA